VPRTVRDATLDVLRARGLTTIFSNPGSTEIPFLADLPDDLRFVLALHEASVVGMATGYALGREQPSLALLHSTPGLGNAVSAIATARTNRVPLVIVVGQQDRRHVTQEPFLTGRLAGLAGEYPVWFAQPPRPQDVPGAVNRAVHEAVTRAGPAIVVVPMDDWLAPAPDRWEVTGPVRVMRGTAVDDGAAATLAAALDASKSPAIVVGAGARSAKAWRELVTLADQLACPVWQEPFSAFAGFPQNHPRFAGFLPSDRSRLRKLLADRDVVLVVGAGAFKQYEYREGPLVPESTAVAIVTEDPEEAHRSPADFALIAPLPAVCAGLSRRVREREGEPPPPWRPEPAPPPAAGEPLRAVHLVSLLAELLPEDAVLVEEAPSTRLELNARVAARSPLGSVSAAMGGLGFALPAAVGLKLALPDRPVAAVVGDGSSLYQIQALWSAAHERAGALFLVVANGGYAVMDQLAARHGGTAPWPGFGEVDLAGIARGLGCDAERIDRYDELERALRDVVPTLAERTEPLLLEVVVRPEKRRRRG